MKRVQQGFTLIELMIVIAIIGILAAIALPAYQDYTVRTQASEGTVLASGAKTAVAEFYNNTGRLPANNTSAGMSAATSITGKYVSQVTVSTGGVVTARYNATNANTAIQGKEVVLSPTTKAGSVEWKCKSATGGTAINLKYLPSSCR